MPDVLVIQGGSLFDPANDIHGDVRDVVIVDDKVVDRLPDGAKPRTIDATGCVVMAGGVEMHSHLVSMTVNAARAIQSATGYHEVCPTAQATGALYARLGYTTGMEAAVPPISANVAHMQLDDLPVLDTGMLLLLGNHEALVELVDKGDRAGAVALVQELLTRTRAYGIKAVNPAAVAAWRRDPAKDHIDSIDDCAAGTKVSPRLMLDVLTEAQETLGLAHPTHIHGPQLGEPGNITITLDMLRSIAGRRCHLAHLQYYAYGKTKGGGFKSAVDQLASYLADHPEVTADLGMVAFGPAFTATADLPLEHALYRHVGSATLPASFLETGNEDCFGVMPLEHAATNPVHAVQWATGLELALSCDRLDQIALTVDHPNGGSFLNYPRLIAMLMSKPLRDEQLADCHRHATTRTGLEGISRELSLSDIAMLTRVAPAKALGLAAKGHLGVGADGDVTVYANNTADAEAMFDRPRWVIKAGRVVVEDGELRDVSLGERLTCGTTTSEQGGTLLEQFVDRRSSVSPSQYARVSPTV